MCGSINRSRISTIAVKRIRYIKKDSFYVHVRKNELLANSALQSEQDILPAILRLSSSWVFPNLTPYPCYDSRKWRASWKRWPHLPRYLSRVVAWQNDRGPFVHVMRKDIERKSIRFLSSSPIWYFVVVHQVIKNPAPNNPPSGFPEEARYCWYSFSTFNVCFIRLGVSPALINGGQEGLTRTRKQENDETTPRLVLRNLCYIFYNKLILFHGLSNWGEIKEEEDYDYDHDDYDDYDGEVSTVYIHLTMLTVILLVILLFVAFLIGTYLAFFSQTKTTPLSPRPKPVPLVGHLHYYP